MINAYTEVANQIIIIKNLNSVHDLKVKEIMALNESTGIPHILFMAARVNYIESPFPQRDGVD